MCAECGGVCALCGDFSTHVIVVPSISSMIYACDEHLDELDARAEEYLDKLDKAKWN